MTQIPDIQRAMAEAIGKVADATCDYDYCPALSNPDECAEAALHAFVEMMPDDPLGRMVFLEKVSQWHEQQTGEKGKQGG
jgi:hypothetical protein